MDYALAVTDKGAADFGFKWSAEPVNDGTGASKRELGQGQIIVLTDLDKARAAFGDAVILGQSDGSSIRVVSQGKCRGMLRKNAKVGPAEMRLAVVQVVAGIRTRTIGPVAVDLSKLSDDELLAELAKRGK